MLSTTTVKSPKVTLSEDSFSTRVLFVPSGFVTCNMTLLDEPAVAVTV